MPPSLAFSVAAGFSLCRGKPPGKDIGRGAYCGEPSQELVGSLDPKANLIMHYLDDIKILLLKH